MSGAGCAHVEEESGDGPRHCHRLSPWSQTQRLSRCSQGWPGTGRERGRKGQLTGTARHRDGPAQAMELGTREGQASLMRRVPRGVVRASKQPHDWEAQRHTRARHPSSRLARHPSLGVRASQGPHRRRALCAARASLWCSRHALLPHPALHPAPDRLPPPPPSPSALRHSICGPPIKWGGPAAAPALLHSICGPPRPPRYCTRGRRTANPGQLVDTRASRPGRVGPGRRVGGSSSAGGRAGGSARKLTISCPGAKW